MEDAVTISWLAVVVAAVVKFGIGAAWYSPALFGNKWQALAGVSSEAMKSRMPMAIAAQATGDLVMAYILARFIGHYGAQGLIAGAFVGFLAWLGFVATIMLGQKFYENRPTEILTINGGYQLVGIAVMGAIIGVM